MNKKNLSVVMAGAMLATSVAPVLAAETTTQKDYTVNNSNKGLLIKELRNLINSKTFANVTANDKYAGDSVYYVQRLNYTSEEMTVSAGYPEVINKIDWIANGNGLTAGSVKDTDLNELKANEETVVLENATNKITVKLSAVGTVGAKAVVKHYQVFDNKNLSALETSIQNSDEGDVYEVWDRGHREKDGKYYAYSKELVAETFTKESLKKSLTDWEANKTAYPAVNEMVLSDDETTLTVYTTRADSETEDGRFKLEYKVGMDRVDFTKAINKDGEELVVNTNENGYPQVVSSEIAGFKTVYLRGEDADEVDIPEKKLYTITVSDVDKSYTVKLSDLYDGLFLTENGQRLLDEMKKYDADKDDVVGVSAVETKNNGLYTLDINFNNTVANGKVEKYVVTVTTNDKEKLTIFHDGIVLKNIDGGEHTTKTRRFPVEVLAGSNRYETAVKVAKENADIRTVSENGNIVLVNGNSLVDGLAAAPLAASVSNMNNSNSGNSLAGHFVAPILLTDANGLPKATKDYMKEVIAHQQVGALDKVTVYLVGGEAVISKAVENDLKEIGFRVVRAGGADREETSLKVAKIMEDDTLAGDGYGSDDVDSAFVVGANGEADAMSIASVAAREKTPIIVESVHGIKGDTIEYLQGYKNKEDKDVTIIGGETAVSKATEQELKDAKLKVERLAGSNRKETNAKVMQTYYEEGKVRQFVVSKDGMRNKSELIDALTATSLAVKHNAPIVLATDKLSDTVGGQINTMELKAHEKGVYVYQVGIGVARDVIQTIANRVGLAK